jgi:hypothetical protein
VLQHEAALTTMQRAADAFDGDIAGRAFHEGACGKHLATADRIEQALIALVEPEAAELRRSVRMRERLGFDYTRANELEVINGRLTGRVTGPAGGEIIDAEGKARALAEACEHLGCSTGRSIAIGDGANDLKMMNLAGISVAYRAKPIVHQHATYALSYARLDGVLAWFANEPRAIRQPSAA